MVRWNERLPSRSRSRLLTRGFGLDSAPRSRRWEPRARPSWYKLQGLVGYALAIILFCAAGMNAGFATASARGAKGKAAGSKSVGTKSDSGGANIEVPQAGSVGAGIKGGNAAGANDGAKGTGAGSSAERGAKGPSDSGAHARTNPDRSNTERGAGSTGANESGAQARHGEPGANPIDIRITVQSPTKLKTATKAPDWTKIVGTSNSLRARPQTSAPGLRIELDRNAIGVLTPREFTPSGVDGTARGAAGTVLRNLASGGRPDCRPASLQPRPHCQDQNECPEGQHGDESFGR